MDKNVSNLNSMDRKKIESAQEDGFIIIEIMKLTVEDESNLSNINICNFLKLPIPILHMDFLKKLSQNLEQVKSYCRGNKPSNYACRRWISLVKSFKKFYSWKKIF